ncbi:phospholipase D family protein [Falsiroseomonas tokyonensis]|uniref:Phospholipase D n=1 Tax=Falsiroseomonas tokyonensis TaxID=430521 RepID=A0ABV7BMD5_9PROT|nr:phospholipase D family protein [Falsiroseomonas tokyonensis]MBU8536754.1 phospholipase D family protein [Falsiroseomonas tokyonensis]
MRESPAMTLAAPEAKGEEAPLVSALDQALAEVLARIGGAEAGAALVPEGLDAFAVRVATARTASRSLDLIYYMWHGDVTGRLLAAEVLAAADRGVRVRLLLDDAYALGRERVLSALDSHPMITVRLFNGTRWRMFGRAGFLLEMLFGGWHLNRRMHNKAWIADGKVAIAGGRNIGDEYFGAKSDEFNFRDLDLVLAGAAVAGTRRVFERYWHNRLARPAAVVCPPADNHRGLPKLRRALAEAAAEPEAVRYLAHLGDFNGAAAPLARGMVAIAPAAVQVVADPPEKAKRGLAARRQARAAGGIAPEIADALRKAQREALLISPYFVPGKAGLALLLDLVARGVKVSVVTNSLAATDVVAVHGGYAHYREPLLRAGVSLFELKPSGEDESTSAFGSRGASLHTKAFVVDDGPIFVGSFNLDPRSAALNTEMGAFVHHPVLARELRAEHDRLADPARSWRLGLEEGRLTWTGAGPQGVLRKLHGEPDASLRRRVLARVLRWLPIESQL